MADGESHSAVRPVDLAHPCQSRTPGPPISETLSTLCMLTAEPVDVALADLEAGKPLPDNHINIGLHHAMWRFWLTTRT